MSRHQPHHAPAAPPAYSHSSYQQLDGSGPRPRRNSQTPASLPAAPSSPLSALSLNSGSNGYTQHPASSPGSPTSPGMERSGRRSMDIGRHHLSFLSSLGDQAAQQQEQASPAASRPLNPLHQYAALASSSSSPSTPRSRWQREAFEGGMQKVASSKKFDDEFRFGDGAGGQDAIGSDGFEGGKPHSHVRIMLVPVASKAQAESSRSHFRKKAVSFVAFLLLAVISTALLVNFPWSTVADLIAGEPFWEDEPTVDPAWALERERLRLPSIVGPLPAAGPLAKPAASCAQEEPLPPTASAALDAVWRSQYSVSNASYHTAIANRLAGMVKINTVVYDDMKSEVPPAPEPDDPRRAGLVTIRSYLMATYPRIHSELSLEVVNRYALLYTWQGSDSSKNPIMLAGHLDTVPVPEETLGGWTYPPWSGTVADGFVWGRGAHDCKAQLVAVMDAVETLLAHGFRPRRTVIIAFGFDEEISGQNGAGAMASVLKSRGHAHQGISLIIDEGSGIDLLGGATFALPSIAEKGYMDVRYTVRVPGGHSSIPPAHTGIGLAAKIIDALEANPGKMSLPDDAPLMGQLRCEVAHGTDVDKQLKGAMERLDAADGGEKEDEARKELIKIAAAKGDVFKALMMTTQAIDIIKGGVKVNALPEVVETIANYRIASDSSVSATERRLLQILLPLSASLNLTLVHRPGSGQTLTYPPPTAAPTFGTLEVETLPGSLEPSPRSVVGNHQWALLAGTIRHALQKQGETLYVSPASPTGNTDTRYYHELSANVYRFSPLRLQKDNHVHTVDERVRIDSIVESSGFFFELIRNADEAAI
ncbi:hypothetical protein HK101_010176 [Irineochytrium annulatum]|nr:hypothetical protein HK101_010176 [Irineochytrium annulatum]